jgi:hypothetical protein
MISPSAIYSAYVVDKEMEPCFFLNHSTRESHKKNAPPLMFFLSSMQLAQSAYE